MATIKTLTHGELYTITIPDAVYDRIRCYLDDAYVQCDCLDEYNRDECYASINIIRAKIGSSIFTLCDLEIITNDEADALKSHYSYLITKAYKEAVHKL